METLGNNLGAKKCKKVHSEYYCELCDYKCSKKYFWERHLLTAKHKEETNGNILETEKVQKSAKSANLCCENCGKMYLYRAGLWKHNKICQTPIKNNNQEICINEPTDKELIMMLIKENSELKSIVMKVVENGTYNTTNNIHTNNTNSHNKAFNLNFFLNETCKDAMNMTDFVESIKLQLSDLENVGKVGYIEGISNIIVKNLKELDVTQRPVHCTDKKREVVYIKDDNKWEKDEEKTQMHKFIKKVVAKNHKMIPKFKEEHPDCLTYHSKYSDQYHKIVYESMGGKGDNDFEKDEKIIKNILKEVVVLKNL